MSKRTDLAIESAASICSVAPIEGIIKKVDLFENEQIEITEISVESQKASEILGKPIGKYITLENVEGCFSLYSDLYNEQVELLAEQLEKLIPMGTEKIMVVGLGNTGITPDSLGPAVADKIFATRHIKRLAKDIDTSDLKEITVIKTGVMAQTGLESSEYVKAVINQIEPQLVVAVDALACSEISHLGTTIQLTDTGISPGSGVENARKELSDKTLGIPCIAVGVPTVADMNTLVAEMSEGNVNNEFNGMIVTPKSIDNLIIRTASIISTSMNRVFHPTLTDEEIASLIF